MQQQTQNKERMRKLGDIIATVEIFAYAPHYRGKTWWMGLIGAIALLSVVFFMIDGFESVTLMVGLALIGGLYYYTHFGQDPEEKTGLVVGEKGIELQSKFYSYQMMEFFYIQEFDTYDVVSIALTQKYTPDLNLYLPKSGLLEALEKLLQTKEVEERTVPNENVVNYLIRILKL